MDSIDTVLSEQFGKSDLRNGSCIYVPVPYIVFSIYNYSLCVRYKNTEQWQQKEVQRKC